MKLRHFHVTVDSAEPGPAVARQIVDVLTVAKVSGVQSVLVVGDNSDRINELEGALNEERRMKREITLQLEKLAQHANVKAYFSAQGGLHALVKDNDSLLAGMQQALQDIARLTSVRDDNSNRIDELRKRVWELEKNIAPELVALEAERDFWRNKAKEMMRK